jgi:hypothetical protein
LRAEETAWGEHKKDPHVPVRKNRKVQEFDRQEGLS